VTNSEHIKCIGSDCLSKEISNLTSPIDFFRYFFDDKLVEHILEQTRIFHAQLHPMKEINIYKTDIEQFLGIVIMMSIVHMPNLRSYWSAVLGKITNIFI